MLDGALDSTFEQWRSMRSAAESSVDCASIQVNESRYRLGVLGLPGTGKTTALRLLAQAAPNITQLGTDAFHHDSSRIAQYIHQLFVLGDRQTALACQVEALCSRILLQHAANSDSVLDEPVEAVRAHMYALFSMGWMTRAETETWLLTYEIGRRQLPRAQSMIVLECRSEKLVTRWKQRGRRRDPLVPRAYLDALQSGLEMELETATQAGVHTARLDTSDRPAKEVADLLLSYMGA